MAILKITGGILAPYGLMKPCEFTVHSKTLTASPNLAAVWDTGLPLVGKSYKAGQDIKVSGQMAGDQTLRTGPAVYEGKYYEKLWFTGSFKFVGEPVACPADSNKPISVRTKFSVTGGFSGFKDNTLGDTGPAIFTFDAIEGKGQATIQLGPSVLDGNVKRREQILLVYAFK